jgi:hypothetical protein
VGLIVPGVALVGILAGFVIFLTAAVMAAQLAGVGSDEGKRQIILVRSIVSLGLATTIWGFATAFCLWSVLSGFPWRGLFPRVRIF